MLPCLEALPSGDAIFKKKHQTELCSVLHISYIFLKLKINIIWEGKARLLLFGEISNIFFKAEDLVI